MRKLILLVVACSIFGSDSLAKVSDSTGVCFRRVSGLDRRGIVINRYESIIVRPSSSLANDIVRLARVSEVRSLLTSPDMTANTWIGASISDTAFDETSGEDCSKLPSFKKNQH
ncbi:MAG: hypothetical protein V4460_08905 [Pseudomonadota bacterium]|jgi:hypothetical protein